MRCLNSSEAAVQSDQRTPSRQTICDDSYASRKGLLAISGAVGFLLLIVCVNIANLTLVRATSRRRELAVRSALGARRWDLIAASLAESVLIAVGGTILGLLLAWWVIDLLIAWGPANLRSRMPVRSTIHWSDVSTLDSKNELGTTRWGRADPTPLTLAYRPAVTSASS